MCRIALPGEILGRLHADLRGDFEDVEIDDAKLRVLAETHDELDFVLVRSIETK